MTDLAILESYHLPESAEPRRLDGLAADGFEAYPTRTSARKACKRGELAVDGEICEGSRFVQPGQRVDRVAVPAKPGKVFPLVLEVVYEDAELAVVNKPPGFAVNGNKYRTVERALPHNLTLSTDLLALAVPRVCHRLDAKTSGLLAVAKTQRALAGLSRAFMEREVRKGYRAVVLGRLEGEGRFDSPVEERAAETHWQAVACTRSLRSEWVTLVDLQPHTGRKHQLRRHLAEAGHPILGDIPYGIEGQILRGKGLFLVARTLSFTHPISGVDLDLQIAHPSKFDTWREREVRRWDNHHLQT